MRTQVVGIAVCTLLLLHAHSVLAQNWSFDARAVGLGGVGETGNVAVNMVDEQRPVPRHRPSPSGSFRSCPTLRTMNPAENDFDLVRTIEYAASPIHYVFGRDSSDTGQQFVTDIRNGELSRDLNSYRGVSLPGSVSAEGLASPSWGGPCQAEPAAKRIVSRHLRRSRAVFFDKDRRDNRPGPGLAARGRNFRSTCATAISALPTTLRLSWRWPSPADTGRAWHGRQPQPETRRTGCTSEPTTTSSRVSITRTSIWAPGSRPTTRDFSP